MKIPWYIIILLIILLALYVLSPFDILPDFTPILGWLDDGILLGLLIYYLRYKRLPGIFYRWKESVKTGQRNNNQYEHAADADKENSNAGSDSRAENIQKDPYEVLGVEPGTGQEKIQAAYRELANKYHPDKVTHLGKEFQDIAQKKFIEIQDAYEKLKVK